MGHGHDHGPGIAHGHSHGGGDLNERRLLLAGVLTTVTLIAEAAGGIISGSLALLADAGHMLTDAAALALAYLAVRVAKRPADWKRTYGFQRFEVLAAFTNGLALFFISAMISFEAIERMFNPVEVLGGPMLAIAAVGLGVNVLTLLILRHGSGANLNVRAALLHVMSDLLGSVAAIVAALVILQTGWTPIDPILSIVITLLILRSAWLITKDAGHILLEGAPERHRRARGAARSRGHGPRRAIGASRACLVAEREPPRHDPACADLRYRAAGASCRCHQSAPQRGLRGRARHCRGGAPRLRRRRAGQELRQGVDASCVVLDQILPIRCYQRVMANLLSPATHGDARPRVMIADKSPVVRSGLRDFITRDGRFEVLEAHASGSAFIAAVEEQPTDIGIIGWSLPDMNGGEILATLKRRHIATRIVVYTGEPGKDVLRQAVRLGAWGFISKSDEPSVLVDSIAAVARGRMSLPYVDLQALTTDPFSELTSRERELLTALANGWTNLQIASRIGISRNTVKYHLKNLYDKLGVSNRAMAVALYMQTTMDQR